MCRKGWLTDVVVYSLYKELVNTAVSVRTNVTLLVGCFAGKEDTRSLPINA